MLAPDSRRQIRRTECATGRSDGTRSAGGSSAARNPALADSSQLTREFLPAMPRMPVLQQELQPSATKKPGMPAYCPAKEGTGTHAKERVFPTRPAQG